MSILNIRPDGLFIDDEPFYLISGDIHYFRIYSDLKRRLKYMKAFGLTTVQTYVPWNLHEPEKGKFVFDGLCDLRGFLEAAHELDLKVLLRPSPYICSEWDLGGLPSWLLHEEMDLRTSDERYLRHIRDYYTRLCKEFVPYLSTNGGPIIAVAVENEYGSFGNDKEYLRALADMLRENGVDVPLFTTDGHDRSMLDNGTLEGIWAGVNYRKESAEAIAALHEFQPDKPAYIGEYWSGRAVHWGEHYAPRDIDEVTNAFREALDCGGLVNFYMFTGGTNFGFMNGANFGRTFSALADRPIRYIPIVTSYETNALINEQGLPTDKYFACRKQLWDFLGKSEPPMPKIDYRTQTVEPIKLGESASLWDQIDYSKAVRSQRPLSMEALGQDYGYCLYKTEAKWYCGNPKLTIPELHDRADVYVNGKYQGTLMREREPYAITLVVTPNETFTLEILVENMGRINFGPRLGEKKGILGGVFLSYVQLFGWDCLSLPMKDLEFVKYNSKQQLSAPCFYRGYFKAEPGIDTFLDMRSFNKGFVFINDFNLGRYWNAGPQYTLYVPGKLLCEDNVIEVFEHYEISDDAEVITSSVSIIE